LFLSNVDLFWSCFSGLYVKARESNTVYLGDNVIVASVYCKLVSFRSKLWKRLGEFFKKDFQHVKQFLCYNVLASENYVFYCLPWYFS